MFVIKECMFISMVWGVAQGRAYNVVCIVNEKALISPQKLTYWNGSSLNPNPKPI